MKRYNPRDIETKWQDTWEQSGIYRAEDDTSKPKKYVLEFFPYPSGAAMHVGHVRNYTIGDALSRFYRMQGNNVLHPMGWDAFGLPAENYAIKSGISPKKAVADNVEHFKAQLQQMGFSYDWSREINSTNPAYYKWTQWLFKLLFERGLAYQKESLQWWCDKCKTVLANEQVVNGKCWRHEGEDDPLVTKRPLRQWFFKITDYADRLIEDLNELDWSEAIKAMQRNWIGKSLGAEIDFAVAKSELRVKNQEIRSFIMGVNDITEKLIHIGVKILDQPSENTYRVTIPAERIRDYEKIITEELQPGFWNEYISDEAVFLFKNEKAEVKRLVLTTANEEEILNLCEKYANTKFNSLFSMLEGNEWYKPFVSKLKSNISNLKIKIFTTRPDTLYGATFMVLAPEHPLVGMLTTKDQEDRVQAYIEQASQKSEVERQVEDREKSGVFTGSYAINPVNQEKIPIWIADYVLMGYGTGAIMAVPAHDERDYVFAKKFNLDIIHVFDNETATDEFYDGEGTVKNSGMYSGLATEEAREKIVADLAQKGAATERVNYKIRDWLISRQRYWGAPIPILWLEKAQARSLNSPEVVIALQQDQTKLIEGREFLAVPVADKVLPVELPDVESYEPDGTGKGPLARDESWVHIWYNVTTGESRPYTDPTNKMAGWAEAYRETDTMDGFACSSWYFLRFADPHNDLVAFDSAKADYWLPVDVYIGGAEHAVMHLLYARMWTKVMYDAGLITFTEPFKSLKNQGMILAPDGRKMSKSYGNTIQPDDLIKDGYGADAIRVMELFIGPWNQSVNWSVEGMGGCYRFLQRVWTLVNEYRASHKAATADKSRELLHITNKAVKKVTADLEELSFNTAVAALMEMVNDLYRVKVEDEYSSEEWSTTLRTLLQLLAPFAPHITEELWHQLEEKQSVHVSSWPKWDESYLMSDTLTLAVQVNGRVRGEIEVASSASETEIIEKAIINENVQKYLEGKIPKKTIYVPGRLVSLVV